MAKEHTTTYAPTWVRSQKIIESGEYWWWNEDEDSAPVPVTVAWSGTDDRFFAEIGQLGWNRPQEVIEMGGWWKLIPQEPIPMLLAESKGAGK